jgi:hypothetical protein
LATLYKPDGSLVAVTPTDAATGFTLEELHALIEAHTLDFRALSPDRVMVCDDVALMTEDPQINLIASLIWWKLGGDRKYPLAGNILIATRREVR